MKNFFGFGLLFILFISGCHTASTPRKALTIPEAAAPEPVAEKNRLALQEAGIKRWKSPAKDIMSTHYLAYYHENGEGYLVWENQFRKALEFYKWESDSLSSSIQLSEALIKRRCSMRGVYVASLDSIYLMDPMDPNNYKFHLFNREGRLLQTLNSGDSSLEGLNKAMPRIDANNQAVRQGDWLHVAGMPEANLFEPDTFALGKIEVSINLKTGAYRYGYHYPEVYQEWGNVHNFNQFSRCLSAEGKFLYSFGLEDSIRLKLDGQTEQLFFAGSAYFPLSAVRSSPTDTGHKQFSFPNHNGIPYYGGILYDPVQEVYYRMALLAIPDHVQKASPADRPISIIILNKKLEKVGETELPAAKHLSYQWFVGPDGLFIANHYNHRQQANIGELSFTRYQLVAEKP